MGGFVAGFLPKAAGTTVGLGLDAYVNAWLIATMTRICAEAKTRCKANQGGVLVDISFMVTGQSQGEIVINQVGGELPHDRIEQWAFDYLFKVPMSGYIAPKPPGYFYLHQPDGTVTKRARVYTKKAGQSVYRKGYMSEAIRAVLTPIYMKAFGAMVAGYTGQIVANYIRSEANSLGFNAVIQ